MATYEPILCPICNWPAREHSEHGGEMMLVTSSDTARLFGKKTCVLSRQAVLIQVLRRMAEDLLTWAELTVVPQLGEEALPRGYDRWKAIMTQLERGMQ